ncbi:MAG: putative DNA binding domain-containing protein [Alphaproteobacteria bacterium]|nr:putative DNA binding domain-containing protein [Alphaproteobacteria bacterium]
MKIYELYNDVVLEDLKYEFKALLNSENPVKWAKTLVAFANGDGGVLFVGVSNEREAFGISLEEIDKTKNLIAIINDRHIFPHIKINFSMRSVDKNAEKFVLGIHVQPSESVVRYKEGDFNEVVYVKGNGNTKPANPEEIISLSKRKKGIDNETSEILYDENQWNSFLELCSEYRKDGSKPSLKELQNEEIVSKDGYVTSGFLMFKDDYNDDDTLICCRLWKGKNKAGVVLDSDKFKGSISKTFVNAYKFIERNTKIGWKKIENGGREEIRSYPKEALINAIAYRDYSINGTQIDVDIYDDRIDIVSPGSWLLPKSYNEYPIGSISSIRRNTIIAACLDVANLMERGGTGFQTMAECYKEYSIEKQPGVLIYPGFLDLRLHDLLFEDNQEISIMKISKKENVIELLKIGPKSVKELQLATGYKSRSQFLKEVINPLINDNIIYREGNDKSPFGLFYLKQELKN